MANVTLTQNLQVNRLERPETNQHRSEGHRSKCGNGSPVIPGGSKRCARSGIRWFSCETRENTGVSSRARHSHADRTSGTHRLGEPNRKKCQPPDVASFHPRTKNRRTGFEPKL